RGMDCADICRPYARRKTRYVRTPEKTEIPARLRRGATAFHFTCEEQINAPLSWRASSTARWPNRSRPLSRAAFSLRHARQSCHYYSAPARTKKPPHLRLLCGTPRSVPRHVPCRRRQGHRAHWLRRELLLRRRRTRNHWSAHKT